LRLIDSAFRLPVVPADPPPLAPHIERILDAARIAPSRDNLQPWRFAVEGETVSFLVDHERDRSPANTGGRMARIAIGAAIECALLRAGRMGAIVRFHALPRTGALATITFSSPKRIPEPDKALLRRATNRHLYDARPVDDATFSWLREATPALESTRTLWFGRERVKALGPILEEGETLFLSDARNREATLAAVRFDVRDREEVTHGLSIGCLELSATERITLDTLRRTPVERLTAMGVFAKMGARARRLMESASGVCVITVTGSEPEAVLAVGRAMQRAWLALTRRGLVAHPMSAIAALEAIGDGADPRVSTVVASARAAFPNAERGSRIGLLLRFGWAPDPTARVRRLPLEESVAAEAAEKSDAEVT
jgi:nitroreductase